MSSPMAIYFFCSSPSFAKHSRNGVEGATPAISLKSLHRSPFVPRARRCETANQSSNDTLRRQLHRQTGQLLHVADCRPANAGSSTLATRTAGLCWASFVVLLWDFLRIHNVNILSADKSYGSSIHRPNHIFYERLGQVIFGYWAG